METKQHAAKKPIGQEWNQIKQKIPRDKWKWKYNLKKSMGFTKKKKTAMNSSVHTNTDLP